MIFMKNVPFCIVIVDCSPQNVNSQFQTCEFPPLSLWHYSTVITKCVYLEIVFWKIINIINILQLDLGVLYYTKIMFFYQVLLIDVLQ